MRDSIRRLGRLLAGLLFCCSAFAQAPDYPNRTLHLIVIAPPGSLQDLVGRVVAQGMSKLLGQPVVVENKTAAGGIVGYEYAARQMPADGYTFVLSSASLATFQLFNKDLRFDPIADLPPFTVLVDTPTVLASPVAAPWKGFNEMIAYAKANPGKLNWGVQGLQGQPVLAAGAIKSRHNVEFTLVPYSVGGSTAVRQALLTNDVQLAWMAVVDEKKLKLLGVGATRRLAAYPDVPTFAELGHPEFTGNWLTLNARAGTPRPVLEKLYAASRSALQQPEMEGLLARNFLVTVALPPDAALKRFNEEAAFFSNIAKQAGIAPQ